MNETTIDLEIYSPRWGHDDTYSVHLTKDVMTITQGGRTARCTWLENLDPKWDGERLEGILNNDSIYPPAEFEDMFEYAWKAWRNGDINDKTVDQELQAVADWLNTITRTKPQTDFWGLYF